jgi:hypothetical protein
MHVLAYKDFLKSTHGKDVIFYHKKFRIFADFNVTDGMPYTDYLSRGDNTSFFPAMNWNMPQYSWNIVENGVKHHKPIYDVMMSALY